MHKIRVIHIMDVASIGGAESALLNLAKNQLKNGLDIKCILTYKKSSLSTVQAFKDAKIPVEIIQHSDNPTKLKSILIALKISRILKCEKKSIIHLHLNYAAKIGRIASLISRCTNIVETYHGYEDFFKLKRWKYLYFPLIKKSTKKFVSVSVALNSKMYSEFGIESTTIGNSLDFAETPYTREEARKNLALPPKKIIVSFVGRFVKDKNIESLLYATQGLPVHLALIGSGELENKLKILAKELGIKAVFLGVKPNAYRYFRAFDALCLPSINEAQGLVLAEAMLQGVPVLGSKIPGIIETLDNGKAGLLHDPHNPQELAKNIEKIINKSAAVEDKVLYALDWSLKKFSPEQQALEYNKIYEKILKND